jgi:hypothetical protein
VLEDQATSARTRRHALAARIGNFERNLMHCTIDHLTVTSPTLAVGSDHVYRSIGVAPVDGGRHPRMGTHNLLLRLGMSRFLEVIAIDPAAQAPARPRWFALDELVATSAPRLATWVAMTPDASACPNPLRQLIGPPEIMSRGTREWLITIPQDGSLALDGTLPSLIEWTTPSTTPASALPDSGCELLELTLSHPQPDRLGELLSALGFLDEVTLIAGAPGLLARIMTPNGVRTLA